MRTMENAPAEVREVGGVSLSLWMLGAHETDVRIVAHKAKLLQQAYELLEEVRPIIGNDELHDRVEAFVNGTAVAHAS